MEAHLIFHNAGRLVVARLKLLVISPFSILPPHFGSSERTYNLVRGLARAHDVIVLYTDYDQIKVPRLQGRPPKNVRMIRIGPSHRLAQTVNPLLLMKGLRLIRHERPDVLIGDHFFSGLHATLLHWLTGVPYVLDEHNAEYVRFERMRRPSARYVKWAERLYCRSADLVFCVSEADREMLVDLGVVESKIEVVLNGIDMEEYCPNPGVRPSVRQALGMREQDPMALFFGKLDYRPNAEAVDLLVHEIMPRVLGQNPAVRFVVCGYNPPLNQHSHPSLMFPGVVSRIQDYINAADVVIVPLISGGGTKLKIIQAIACGRQVITTPIGAEGIHQAGEWMQVADNWDQFAELIVENLTHPPSSSLHTLQAFRATYSWDQTAQQAIHAIETRLRVAHRTIVTER